MEKRTRNAEIILKEKAEKALSESAASAQQTVQDAKAKAEQIVSEAREENREKLSGLKKPEW